jgi:hypothetical protein
MKSPFPPLGTGVVEKGEGECGTSSWPFVKFDPPA